MKYMEYISRILRDVLVPTANGSYTTKEETPQAVIRDKHVSIFSTFRQVEAIFRRCNLCETKVSVLRFVPIKDI